MSLSCDNQGRVKVRDIMNNVNNNETNITVLENGLNSTILQTNINTTNISNNTSRISVLETSGSSLPALDARLGIVETRSTDNETNIGSLDTAMDTLVNPTTGILPSMDTEIQAIKGDVATNTLDIAAVTLSVDNKVDKADLLTPSDPATNKIVTESDMMSQISEYSGIAVTLPTDPTPNLIVTTNELNLAFQEAKFGYAIVSNRVAMNDDGGTATVGSWEVRNLSSLDFDSIGISSIGNRIQLPEIGHYVIDGYAVADDSIYHQARLFNETDGTPIINGSSAKGTSNFHCVFETTVADTTIRLESQVDATLVDIGYGSANPFEEGVFALVRIIYVGA